jgi:hypothetical protein
VAKQNTQQRLRNKGGLKTLFLAAALFVTPTNLDFSASAEEFSQTVQYHAPTNFAVQLASRVEKDWERCNIVMADGVPTLNGALRQSLAETKSEKVQDTLAYIEENNLRFCGVDDRRIANKYDAGKHMYSVLWQQDGRINEINMLHLALEHKFASFMHEPAFKTWDYKSQLVFALSAKARARAEIGMVVQDLARENPEYADTVASYTPEFKALYEAGSAGQSDAVQSYVTGYLNTPHIYSYYAPQMLTSFFEELAVNEGRPISEIKPNVLWDDVAGRNALLKIGLSAAVIPHASDVKRLLGKYEAQLAYLHNQRVSPHLFLYSRENKYADVAMDDLRVLYQNSGYTLNISQVFERVLKGPFDKRYAQLNADKNVAIQADFMDYQINADQAFLWNNIQRIKSSQTVIGQLLYKHAVDYNVFFNEESVYETATGTWSTYNNMVSVRPHDHEGYDHHYAVGTVAHELLHSVQDKRGIIEFSNHWALDEYQMQVMSYEAAAFVTARLTAFELQINDYDSAPWKSIAHSQVAKTIEATYMEHIQTDKTHLESLEYAGAAAWETLFKNDSWLDTYNKWVLKLYLEKLQGGVLTVDRNQDFTLAEARQDGYISPLFNTTARIDALPQRSDLFGKNESMRQLFDFIELNFLGQKQGEQSAAYTNLKDKLEAHDNPFLGREILKKIIISERTGRDIYNQILCAAEQPECKPPEVPQAPSV